MKLKTLISLVLAIFTLSACSTPAPTLTPVLEKMFTPQIEKTQLQTITPIRTELPSLTSLLTPTSLPSRTPSPLPTILPTAGFTPPTILPVAKHSLALDVGNIKDGMGRLARVGDGGARELAWSPDGKYLAVATGIGIRLYDALTFDEVRLIDLDDGVWSIAFSPDSSTIAISTETRVGLWDVESGKKVKDLQAGIEQVTELAYSTYGYVIAQGYPKGGGEHLHTKLVIWKTSTGEVVYTENHHSDAPIDISPDGKLVITGSDDADHTGFNVREIANGNLVFSYPQGYRVIFDASGKNYFFTMDDAVTELMLYKADTGEAHLVEGITCGHISHNGSIGVCHYGYAIVLFSLEDGQLIKTLPAEAAYYRAVISPSGEVLATNINGVELWDISTGQAFKTIPFQGKWLSAVTLASIDNSLLYLAASVDSSDITIWDLGSSQVIQSWPVGDEEITGLAFSPDQVTLATISVQGIKLWDFRTGVQTAYYDMKIESMCDQYLFSPDGSKIAMLNDSGNGEHIAELDLQTGKLVDKGSSPDLYWSGPYGPFFYNNDGHLMSWGKKSGDKEELYLHDLTAIGIIPTSYTWSPDPFTGVDTIALSLDNKYLAVGSTGSAIYIFDMQTMKRIQVIEAGYWGSGMEATIRHLMFSPETDLLVSVGYDDAVCLWNIHTGELLWKIDINDTTYFSPDGRLLIIQEDSVIRIWGIAPWP